MNRKIGLVFSYGVMITEIVSAMFVTPFIIRSLGQAEYGIYQLTSSITAYLIIFDLGVGNSVIRYMAKFRANNDRESQRKFLGVTTVYYAAVTLVILIVGVLLITVFPNVFSKGLTSSEIVKAKELLSITIVTSAISIGTSAFSNTLVAYERFTAHKGIMILANIAKMAVLVFLMKMGVKSVGVVTVNLIVTAATRLFYICYVFFKLKLYPSFKKIDTSFVKGVFSYSTFVLIQLIAQQLNSMSDQIILGIFAPSAAILIGIYGVGSQIVQYYKTIGSQFNSVLMAGTVRMIEGGADSKTVQNEMVRIGRVIFMVLGMIYCVFAVFGRDFVALWAGKDNIDGYFVALIIMFPWLISTPQGIGNQILWAINRHKTLAIIQICSSVFNIIVTIFLIKWKPLVGSSLGTALALIIGDVVLMDIVLRKEVGIRFGEYYRDLFKGTLPALLITFAFGAAFSLLHLNRYGWAGLIINCVITAAVYAADDYGRNRLIRQCGAQQIFADRHRRNPHFFKR